MASNENKEQKTRGKSVRQSNITAARAVADAVRTSLGPKGMDKMIISPQNDVSPRPPRWAQRRPFRPPTRPPT